MIRAGQAIALQWIGNFYGEKGNMKFDIWYPWGTLEVTIRKKSVGQEPNNGADFVIMDEPIK